MVRSMNHRQAPSPWSSRLRLGSTGSMPSQRKKAAQRFIVERLVGHDHVWLPFGATWLASDGRHVDDQWQHGRDIVLVGGNRLDD